MTAKGEDYCDAFVEGGLVRSKGEFKALVRGGGLWASNAEGDEDRVGMRRITAEECGL